MIWDSLAIAEYLAEKFPDKRLWPDDAAARAVARSMCAEMHAGFQTLRSALTMNFDAEFPGRGWNVKVQKEIDRIVAMWQDARARFGAGGPFLFGRFSIADAYFAPMVRRFVGLRGQAARRWPPAYAETITALPAMLDWAAGGPGRARLRGRATSPIDRHRRRAAGLEDHGRWLAFPRPTP